MSRLGTNAGALLLPLLLACGRGDAPGAPEPSFHRDPSGALFCTFDPGELNAFLAAMELPAPTPELSVVEGGSGESFARLLHRLADERSGVALGELGMFFHGYRRSELAEECYRRASEQEPRSPWWPHYRGDLAESAEELDRAVELFGEAARLDPGAAAPRARRARVLRAQGRAPELEQQLEELLRVDPDSLFALTELASLALDDGAPERAEPMLQRALESWPRQRRVHVLLARVHQMTGRLEQAERFRRSSSEARELTTLLIDPWMARLEAVTDSILYWKTGARELQQAGRWAELLQVARELDRREPGPRWKAMQVRALVSLGRAPEARALGAELAAAHPESALGFEAQAWVQLADGRFDEALASAEQALERDPSSWPAREILVKSHLGLGQGARAIELVDGLCELHPHDFVALALTLHVHRSLGATAIEQSRWPEAAVHVAAVQDALERARELAPDDPLCEEAEEWLVAARRRLAGG